MAPADPTGDLLHATTVALNGRGLIILGASGSGKSALALQLMALGAQLVADDRTQITREGDSLIARPPPQIAGMIEARGIGLLQADHLESAPLHLAVNLDIRETERLPHPHHWTCQGLTLPCLHNPEAAHFPAALVQYLRGEGTRHA